MFTFHVMSLPHTVASTTFISCAYTQKVVKFCKMMVDRGHVVYLYAHKDSTAECTRLVPVTNDQVLIETYGKYDWKTEQFKHSITDNAQVVFNQNAIRQLDNYKKAGDFLLCFWGYGHKDIADAHPDLIPVEPGIGYHTGLFAPYRVFESYSVRDIAYEKMGWGNPSWNDAIIPNYFDPADFSYQEEKEDYFLFLGRLVEIKGLYIAVQAAERAGVKLKIAGQGDYARDFGTVPAHVQIEGFADTEKRKKLLAGAKALFVPSYYVEPFGGVMIEAFFSGTPVISSDWGSFAENNLHGITGWRCRTMEQFVWATKNAGSIKPAACREWAEQNFSLDAIAPSYEEFFATVQRTHKDGWYAENPEREDLDWMTKKYPKN